VVKGRERAIGKAHHDPVPARNRSFLVLPSGCRCRKDPQRSDCDPHRKGSTPSSNHQQQITAPLAPERGPHIDEPLTVLRANAANPRMHPAAGRGIGALPHGLDVSPTRVQDGSGDTHISHASRSDRT